MLTSTERPRGTASRIKGRPAIVRSLRGLLIRTHRFGHCRARSREDVLWAARTIDVLMLALRVATGDHLNTRAHLDDEAPRRRLVNTDQLHESTNSLPVTGGGNAC